MYISSFVQTAWISMLDFRHCDCIQRIWRIKGKVLLSGRTVCLSGVYNSLQIPNGHQSHWTAISSPAHWEPVSMLLTRWEPLQSFCLSSNVLTGLARQLLTSVSF